MRRTPGLVHSRPSCGRIVGRRAQRETQLDPKLTLRSATKMARNSEEVKQQQTEIRRKEHSTVTVVEIRKSGHRRSSHKETETQSQVPLGQRTAKNDNTGRCRWCVGAHSHTKVRCPVMGKICNSCGKKGHYAVVCLSSARKGALPNRSSQRRQCMEVHLVEVRSATTKEPWRVTAKLNGTLLVFKIDIGAEVTAVSPKDDSGDIMEPLETTNQTLTRPGQVSVATAGYFTAIMEWRYTRVKRRSLASKG